MYWCMFEQSGTFKRELVRLGECAIDVDILNDFGETDIQADIFDMLDKRLKGVSTPLDLIRQTDTVIAFFPCVRFEGQILLKFTGNSFGLDKWNERDLLSYNQRLQGELFDLISYLNKLVQFAFDVGFRLIIENPWGSYSYLRERWCFKPSIVIPNRRIHGDYFKKPTAFWFFNGVPFDNVYFEPVVLPDKKTVESCNTVERSMISPQFARYFLRSFVLPTDNK